MESPWLKPKARHQIIPKSLILSSAIFNQKILGVRNLLPHPRLAKNIISLKDLLYYDNSTKILNTHLVVESKLGYVEVKIAESAGIYFKVQIGNRTTFPTKGVLRYDNQVSNAGGGMNLKTGTFTAPKAGVYLFSFSLLMDGFSFDHLTVSLRLNRSIIGGIGAGAAYYANLATMQSVLKLK